MDHPQGPGASAPFFRGQPPRFRDVPFLGHPDGRCLVRSVEHEVQLEIEGEGADVEVARSQEGETVVHGHGLGMEDVGLEKIDFHAHVQEDVEVGLGGAPHEELVAPLRDDELNPDIAKGSRFQGVEQLIVGDEVRSRYDHPFFCPVEGCHHEALVILQGVGRSAGHRLENRPSRPFRPGEDPLRGKKFPGLHVPVLHEDPLELQDHRPVSRRTDPSTAVLPPCLRRKAR